MYMLGQLFNMLVILLALFSQIEEVLVTFKLHITIPQLNYSEIIPVEYSCSALTITRCNRCFWLADIEDVTIY
jgi:hypothetical protein